MPNLDRAKVQELAEWLQGPGTNRYMSTPESLRNILFDVFDAMSLPPCEGRTRRQTLAWCRKWLEENKDA